MSGGDTFEKKDQAPPINRFSYLNFTELYYEKFKLINELQRIKSQIRSAKDCLRKDNPEEDEIYEEAETAAKLNSAQEAGIYDWQVKEYYAAKSHLRQRPKGYLAHVHAPVNYVSGISEEEMRSLNDEISMNNYDETRKEVLSELLIATRGIAPKAISCVGIVGTGAQAYYQLKFLSFATECRRAMIWGP